MKHVAWAFSGFQTHSDKCRFGTETVRTGAGACWDGARGGLEFFGRGAGIVWFKQSCTVVTQIVK